MTVFRERFIAADCCFVYFPHPCPQNRHDHSSCWTLIQWGDVTDNSFGDMKSPDVLLCVFSDADVCKAGGEDVNVLL